MPIPDSGVCAAVGYAEQSGIPMRMGLIRNHYVGRTFIQPQQSIRHFGVRVKLNPVKSILNGKRVVLVDDSIVRGTTSRKIVRMVRSAGAREVHMRISCPPTISPCFYGVDTPRRSELIAATHTMEEIRKYLDADSVSYLSLDGMTDSVPSKAYQWSAKLDHHFNNSVALNGFVLDQVSHEVQIEGGKGAVPGLEVHPLLVQLRMGLGEHQQVVPQRHRYDGADHRGQHDGPRQDARKAGHRFP